MPNKKCTNSKVLNLILLILRSRIFVLIVIYLSISIVAFNLLQTENRAEDRLSDIIQRTLESTKDTTVVIYKVEIYTDKDIVTYYSKQRPKDINKQYSEFKCISGSTPITVLNRDIVELNQVKIIKSEVRELNNTAERSY